MNSADKEAIRAGDLVQISPAHENNPMFRACILTVTEVKAWGVQGYVQALGENGNMGGQAYYRIKWDDIEYVGKAAWGVEREEEEEE